MSGSEFRRRVRDVIEILPDQYFYPTQTICKVLNFENVSYVRYFVLPKMDNCFLLRFGQRILIAKRKPWFDIISSSTYFYIEGKFWWFDIRRYLDLIEEIEEIREDEGWE